MKKEYETPAVDVFVFETPEMVMDSGGECSGFNCPDGICPLEGGGCIDFCVLENGYSGVY